MHQQTGSLSRRRVEPLFDAGMALFFLSVWLAPGTFGPADEVIRAAMVIMMVEFILIHSAGLLGVVAFAPEITRQKKLAVMGGLSLFYLMFLAGMWAALEAWWVVLAFGWLLAGKLGIAFRRDASDDWRRERMRTDWITSLSCYIVGVLISMLGGVLPHFGITPEFQPEFGENTSGIWMDHPHGVVAMGVFYFTAMAIAKWRSSRRVRPADG